MHSAWTRQQLIRDMRMDCVLEKKEPRPEPEIMKQPHGIVVDDMLMVRITFHAVLRLEQGTGSLHVHGRQGEPTGSHTEGPT